MRILFTGASSFTGYWFVKTLASRGHKVVACLQSDNLAHYQGVRAKRVAQLQEIAEIAPGISFGSNRFLELIASENFDVLCHHGADVTNYKSPDFDYLGAAQRNTHNIGKVVTNLQKSKAQAIVLTSSVFEAGLGVGEQPLRAFNPYGLSKTLTREIFSYYAAIAKIPLKVFVIPNPFGIFEEPRFINYLVESWSKGITPTVKTPLYLRDNIPVDLLALAYCDFVEKKTSDQKEFAYPQGYVESQGQFAQRCAAIFSKQLGLQFSVQLEQQTDFSEPLMRVNTQSVRASHADWNEDSFWKEYVAYYRALYFSG